MFGLPPSIIQLVTLPSGPFKILVTGGSLYSAVEVLQFNGPSATALQVAYDSEVNATSSAARLAAVRRSRVTLRPKVVFPPFAGTR